MEMILHWDREGRPIEDVMTWAKAFEDAETRIVAVDQDAPDTLMVSTIWQGLDLGHSLHQDEPGFTPMIFETAVLTPDSRGAGHIEQRVIAATEIEARTNHHNLCLELLGRLPAPNNGLKDEIVRRERLMKEGG